MFLKFATEFMSKTNISPKLILPSDHFGIIQP